ncbi:tetrahydrofolate dehydrogenase/cyclohydrolase [Gigaspora rosea]|uniref:Tetrahydrofolate dehydrogenase/cyclohydrolase n=1 Tax=Gigaspora rosea TaxID=44941 RepID=A0A397VXV0_9GLOM|nr:tetrahydrofolate dehydrogenase/cyclohydrolase [Gigaspora rosea]
MEAKKSLNVQPKVVVLLPTNVTGKARIDSANYVAKKREVFEQLDIPMQLIKISPQYNEARIKELIKELSGDPNNTGVFLQLPFPSGFSINKDNIINTIPIHKDIDGLTRGSVGSLFDLDKGLKPATPLGICSIFDYYNIPTEGKHIVIMGKGKLVGQPLACMLMGPPYNATTTICDIHTENIKTITKSADILVVAIGKALHVNDDFVKPRVIVIDADINRCRQTLLMEIRKSWATLIIQYTKNVNIILQCHEELIIRQNYRVKTVEKIKTYIDIKKNNRRLNLLLFSSTYNNMTQRLMNELIRIGHKVTFQIADSDDAMRHAFAQNKPDLIICPTLMKAIPEDIYTKVKCLIVHPGIKGDRGPSSLDWVIIDKKDEWGVTVLEADKEMDAGAIWASENFLVPKVTTKTHLYNSHVINTASKLVLECVEKFQSNDFKPEPLNYADASVKGRLHETINQAHSNRQINWEMDTTEIILRKIRSADTQPGVKAEIDINGQKITRFLYDAHNEKTINKDLVTYPGKVLAKRDDAICIATKDGELSENIPMINHEQGLKAPNPDTFQEISFELFGNYGILHFNFYNGAMSTSQCERLLEAIKQCQNISIKGLILAGSANNWSNGINLNVIQNVPNPSLEGWENIKAIDKVVKEIIKLTDIISIAAVQANAGAGGVYLALATDFSFVKPGVVLNPHYKNMGLYGSELHTYTTSKRIDMFMLENAKPMLAIEATEIGLFDNLKQEKTNAEHNFLNNVKEFMNTIISDTAQFTKFLKDKQAIRMQDESANHWTNMKNMN